MLDNLHRCHNGRIRIGPVHFSQAVTPVFDEHQARIGFAVEWHGRTEEIALEGCISTLMENASRVASATACRSCPGRVSPGP